MNLIVVHSFAHRLLNNGIIESAPVCGETEIEIDGDDWRQRTEDSMDLSGGDVQLIRQTLETLSYVFASDEQRLPRSTPAAETTTDPMAPRG